MSVPYSRMLITTVVPAVARAGFAAVRFNQRSQTRKVVMLKNVSGAEGLEKP